MKRREPTKRHILLHVINQLVIGDAECVSFLKTFKNENKIRKRRARINISVYFELGYLKSFPKIVVHFQN